MVNLVVQLQNLFIMLALFFGCQGAFKLVARVTIIPAALLHGFGQFL